MIKGNIKKLEEQNKQLKEQAKLNYNVEYRRNYGTIWLYKEKFLNNLHIQ